MRSWTQMEKTWWPLRSWQPPFSSPPFFHAVIKQKKLTHSPTLWRISREKIDPLTKHLISRAVWNVRQQIKALSTNLSELNAPNKQLNIADINTYYCALVLWIWQTLLDDEHFVIQRMTHGKYSFHFLKCCRIAFRNVLLCWNWFNLNGKLRATINFKNVQVCFASFICLRKQKQTNIIMFLGPIAQRYPIT